MTSTRLPMFPLSAVLFPNERLPLHIFEPRYRQLVADCTGPPDEPRAGFGIVLITRGSEVGGGEERDLIGTAVAIDETLSLDDGGFLLVVRGLWRISIERWLPDDPYPLAIVEPDPPAAWAAFSAEDAALVARAAGAVARVGTLLSEMGESSHLPPPGVPLPVDRSVSSNPADPPGEALVWQLCADLPCSAYDRQRLLAARDQRRRLQLVAELGTELGDDLVRMMGGEPR